MTSHAAALLSIGILTAGRKLVLVVDNRTFAANAAQVITAVSRKRAHGRCTLLCAQTGRWADICDITAFYHENAPMFTLSQPTTGYCTPTHLPSTSLIQFSVCVSQACVASHKWTSDSVPTFQEKDSNSTR